MASCMFMALRAHGRFLLFLALVACADRAPVTRPEPVASLMGSPAAQPNAAADEFLTVQNQARAAVGVPPLQWSTDLAAEASKMVQYQKEQKGCDFVDMSSSPYGANQAWTSYPPSPAEVVGSWVAQGKYYNHDDNTCDTDAAQGDCGTYTQVVWRRTAAVGCAQATCAGQQEGATISLCLYNPHGNVQGQRPY
ncbi:STS14 protein-like [Ananas comosus]|uniref:STS14 protein-like n=1 Tax=Ananas comosus TaxID=4615 RepID=A0A6P5G706_ANACO|nr:STS14 protein-like [Ananas comosus]